MFVIPTFLRSCFPVHALGKSSLTILLLSSALCFLVSSYKIDGSCQNYKGNDITEDVEKAFIEVKKMARNAFIKSFEARTREGGSTNHLLVSLFGTDRESRNTLIDYFDRLSFLSHTLSLTLVCDDQGVQLEPDTFQSTPNPLGVWVDRRHKWVVDFNKFVPCDPARKPGASPVPYYAYSVNNIIYLCPQILDMPIGRSLAPYKDQSLTGKHIDDYICLPVVLFHELLHVIFDRKPLIPLMISYDGLFNTR